MYWRTLKEIWGVYLIMSLLRKYNKLIMHILSREIGAIILRVHLFQFNALHRINLFLTLIYSYCKHQKGQLQSFIIFLGLIYRKVLDQNCFISYLNGKSIIRINIPDIILHSKCKTSWNLYWFSGIKEGDFIQQITCSYS